MQDILVKEDALIKDHQDFIEAFVQHDNFPWFLQQHIAGFDKEFKDPNVVHSIGLTHVALRDETINSKYYQEELNLEGIVVDLANSLGVTLEKILRIKLNLTTPITNYKSNNFCLPHQDMEIPHWVLLYYINDSDGDTILFETPNSVFDDELVIAHRITPKKGKCVLFNGSIFHTQSNPINSQIRLNLNVNVILGNTDDQN